MSVRPETRRLAAGLVLRSRNGDVPESLAGMSKDDAITLRLWLNDASNVLGEIARPASAPPPRQKPPWWLINRAARRLWLSETPIPETKP